ncbi:hypothetical protein GCM10009092_36060 [Bowmanella denitrificans]|uniref:Co-chaperone DjlA N-terminal domain-containing protein n=1 Tax=Bowmanella denitrificans TaxID=366582 RepID=A0ABP3HE64_9ALTE
MHLVLAILGVVVTILVLLNRLQQGGIDLGWLNPFSWHRRRKFRQEYTLSAAYTLDNPMDVAALFIVGVAKLNGDMSKEQKQRILSLFQSEFHLSEQASVELLSASVHLYGRGDEVLNYPDKVLHRSKSAFSTEQIQSVVFMMNEVAKVEGQPNEAQHKLIEGFEQCFPKLVKASW